MKFRNLKKQKNSNTKPVVKPLYATYPLKIKAFITDMFMIYAPILYILAYLVMDGKDAFQSSQLAPLVAVTLYGVIYALFLSKNGQTPGKKAYDLKVVDAKTLQHISFFRALCRFILFLFSASTLIGVLLPLYRKDKKGLHDIVCSTVEIIKED